MPDTKFGLFKPEEYNHEDHKVHEGANQRFEGKKKVSSVVL
ncbi:hypothetical protein FACS189476_12430 [Spirochaetia bacterium]|nr:hypothetical protein FACS189476_12430 [Spirochaetia bacterium]